MDYDREAALVVRVGAQVTQLVQILSADLFDTNAGDVADDLPEMHQLAFADFKRQHPKISH